MKKPTNKPMARIEAVLVEAPDGNLAGHKHCSGDSTSLMILLGDLCRAVAEQYHIQMDDVMRAVRVAATWPDRQSVTVDLTEMRKQRAKEETP